MGATTEERAALRRPSGGRPPRELTFRGRTGRENGDRPGARPEPGHAERNLALLLAASVALAALSLLLPSTPTYDPWAWITWGREIAHLELNTVDGPSWKPLPVLLTTPFSLAGDAARELWLVTARAGGLLAVAMAYRLAARLAQGRFAPVAGAAAVGGLLLSDDFIRNVALGNSEGLLVASVLLGIERHLDGHRGHALALGFAAALLRPEMWPFFGLYGIFVWRAEPERRRLVAGLFALVPALWFLPELWGSGDVLRSSDRAQQDLSVNSPARAEQPALEALSRAEQLLIPPLKIAAAAGLAFAAWAVWRTRARSAHRAPGRGADRDRIALFLGAAGLAWLALVAVMTQAGYAGNPRYLVLPGSICCILAGVGVARSAGLASRLASRGPLRRRGAVAAGWAVAAGLDAAALPVAIEQRDEVDRQFDRLDYEVTLADQLDESIAAAGGRDRILACGTPYTGPFAVTSLAWRLE